MTDRYADADPEQTVTVTGVGHMTLRRAVHEYDDRREHHGLRPVIVYPRGRQRTVLRYGRPGPACRDGAL